MLPRDGDARHDGEAAVDEEPKVPAPINNGVEALLLSLDLEKRTLQEGLRVDLRDRSGEAVERSEAGAACFLEEEGKDETMKT